MLRTALGATVPVVAALVGSLAGLALAPMQTCTPTGQQTEMVIPGVILTWDSAWRCADAPSVGTYAITVRITNATHSAEAVRIDAARLNWTTPRPRSQGPVATAVAGGLPLVIAPGEQGTFSIQGNYTRVETDEGAKANLHLRAIGQGMRSAEPLVLGINVHLRGVGAVVVKLAALAHPAGSAGHDLSLRGIALS